MKLVRNQGIYWDFIRDLRDHPEVKGGFISQKDISDKEHYRFMEKHELNYYVCLVDDNPAGFVGVISGDIRVATHPDYQGMGVGKFMINELMKIYPKSYAKIKLNNKASIRLFETCGFKKKYYILERE